MGVAIKDTSVLYSASGTNIGHVDVNVDPTKPASITITPASPTLAATAGSTVQLTATIYPTTASDSITWSSSDTSIATVSSSGLVTRQAPLTSDNGQPFSVEITASTSNGVSTTVTITASVLNLPTGAWAIFDGILGATANELIWADKSGNSRDMTLGYGEASEHWETDHLKCPANKAYWGSVNNSGFVAQNPFSFSFLIGYDSSASNYNTSQGANDLDCLVCINFGMTPRQQIGIGQRGSENANKIMSAVKPDSNTSWDTLYTSSAVNLGGVKLITVTRNGTTEKIYVDGVLIDTLTHTHTMPQTQNDRLSFFATADGYTTLNSAYKYNYFGNVYAINIYAKELTQSEITAIKNYYKARYNSYNPS